MPSSATKQHSQFADWPPHKLVTYLQVTLIPLPIHCRYGIPPQPPNYQIQKHQPPDPLIIEEIQRIKSDQPSEFQIDDSGVLERQARIWVPDQPQSKETLLREAHNTQYTTHPGMCENVSRLEGNFLGAKHEAGHSRICRPMRPLPKDQSLTPTSSRTGNTWMKMGGYLYGLHNKFSSHYPKRSMPFGLSWIVFQISPFHCN